ncbi:MAG: ATP synthase subunit delta [Candidatus Dependentiae bacterium ADurb.Bin331]|nr:MAG: ATP synthase subunit delta [Candidatus Dependentiae bacterium ADurb.Bin331]
MKIEYASLIHKYVRAFLNVYAQQLDTVQVKKIGQINAFFKTHPQTIFFLKLPVQFNAIKEAMIKKIVDQLNISVSVQSLISLLLKQQRLFLLPHICARIEREFEQQQGIMRFIITSSHVLSEKQQQSITHFLAKKTGKKIERIQKIDPKLIAGVRLQSDTLLWEYSIAKQLRDAERLLSDGN